jgi:Tfp pilus assembly protein PilF
VRDYSEAIKLDPKNAETYNNRANVYSLLGKYDLALKDYDRAIELDGKNARIYGNRGMVKLRLGKEDDAQRDFKKAIELEPGLKQKLDAVLGEQKKPATRESR